MISFVIAIILGGVIFFTVSYFMVVRTTKRMDLPTVLFGSHQLSIPSYPMPEAHFGQGDYAASEFKAWVSAYPSYLVHQSGDLLFVSAEQKAGLEAFVRNTNIPQLQVLDPWITLTEPYVDGEWDTDDAQLAPHFTEQEIDSIRKRVKRSLLVLTYLIWEWVGYSVFDVLTTYGRGKRYAWVLAVYWQGNPQHKEKA